MTLSSEEIAEFKAIYRDQFGEEITDERAYELGSRLINMMKIIYKPIDPKAILETKPNTAPTGGRQK